MADAVFTESADDLPDIQKMKVADLKKELKSRGLSTVGNKNELIERLQNSTSNDILGDDPGNNDESELLDEDDVLEDGLDDDGLSVEGISEGNDAHTTEIPLTTSPTTVTTLTKGVHPIKRKAAAPAKKSDATNQPPKKITLVRNNSVSVTSEKENNGESGTSGEEKKDNENDESTPSKKIIKLSGYSVQDRLALRAQKFGAPTTDSSKKEARAVRFGTSQAQVTPAASAEVLKKRAERFGSSVSPFLQKTEQEEKMKQRQQRFGVSEGGEAASTEVEEKKRLRAERFKIAV